MITVQVLEPTDTIEPNDWVRQLSLHYDGQSDYLPRNNTYSGKPMNRMGWIIAQFVCPFWVGKTVSEFTERTGLPYEFVRGPIPVSHQEELTAEEQARLMRLFGQ